MITQNTRLVCLVHENFDDLELWYPVIRLREAGAQVDLAGEEAGREYTGKHGVPAVTEVSFRDLDPSLYDGVLTPGGWAPDKLRRYSEVKDFVRAMDSGKKLIGMICHAGWVQISAGILKGRQVTSTTAIRDDLENAGARWVDQEVVRDGHIISSRSPKDLPFYLREIIDFLGGEKHS